MLELKDYQQRSLDVLESYFRLVQFITGMANIRDVIPFPRTPGNAEF